MLSCPRGGGSTAVTSDFFFYNVSLDLTLARTPVLHIKKFFRGVVPFKRANWNNPSAHLCLFSFLDLKYHFTRFESNSGKLFYVLFSGLPHLICELSGESQ